MSVTFNGVTLPLARVRGGALPQRDKVWEYPGNDGVESMRMGLGARTVAVRTIAQAGSPSRATLEGLMDGEQHTLAADGDSFGSCVCIAVDQVSKWKNGASGSIDVEYELLFRQEVPD